MRQKRLLTVRSGLDSISGEEGSWGGGGAVRMSNSRSRGGSMVGADRLNVPAIDTFSH